MAQTKGQIAAHKAWETIKKNKELFDGFEKPLPEFKFGMHIEPTLSATGSSEEERVFYYPSKDAMANDIEAFKNDDQVSGITIFEVMVMRNTGFE